MKAKKIIEKYEELWSKIRDLIRSITKNSDDYDHQYMKIKFNSEDKLSLNKAIEIPINVSEGIDVNKTNA